MRELTEAELDLISGGGTTPTTEDIVVTAAPYPSYTPPYYGGYPYYYGGPTSSPPTSGGGGGGGGYATAGASGAANAFANAHIKNQGTLPGDVDAANKAHDEYAKFYDHAVAHPNATIDIGQGHSITYSQALTDLGKTDIVITDTGGGSNGANTNQVGNFAVIEYNPHNQNVIGYGGQPGTAGIDYVMFHEIGHAINFYEHNVAFSDEAAANTTGRSLESALGIAQLPNPAPGGYD